MYGVCEVKKIGGFSIHNSEILKRIFTVLYKKIETLKLNLDSNCKITENQTNFLFDDLQRENIL